MTHISSKPVNRMAGFTPQVVVATASTQAELLHAVDHDHAPIRCSATNYAAGWAIAPHQHNKHQLIHALQGVMAVSTAHGHWVVPPSRGLWMPAGETHAIRCMGEVHMRSLFVRPEVAPKLFMACSVVAVSPLLRELIRAAADVVHPCVPNSRDGRLLRLMLDELRALPVLPLSLPTPSDARIAHICERLIKQPGDNSPLADWAQHLGVTDKTIQRLFMAQTGMSFGRWRQQARLLRALELLARGDKVIDIALALGYESPSAFTTMFKKQFGQAPSQFFDAA